MERKEGIEIARRCGLPRISALLALLLSGCLYSTQHYNSGRILDPGRTSVTLGAGQQRGFKYDCAQDYSIWWGLDSTGTRCRGSEYVPDAGGGQGAYIERTKPAIRTNTSSPKASLEYRLGLHGRWGPFPGFDGGLHLEAPTNPASGEFDVKMGLPAGRRSAWAHSLSAGWGIGLWADNSYFLEYALSLPVFRHALFGNYRATYLATQASDLKEAETRRRFDSRRRLIHQASLGFLWNLPELAVLPDFLAPQVNLTYPLAPAGTDRIPAAALDDRQWDASLGFGWNLR